MAQTKDKPRVVVVDDEPDFLTVVEGYLEPEFEVVTLSHARGLAERIQELDPDLLILDVNLPGRDGLSACREITRDRRFQTLPVMFLTGSYDDKDFIRGVAAGCSTYLRKPLSRAELLGCVREFVGPAQSQAW